MDGKNHIQPLKFLSKTSGRFNVRNRYLPKSKTFIFYSSKNLNTNFLLLYFDKTNHLLGVPEDNIPSIEPLALTNFSFTTIRVNFTSEDAKLYGLSKFYVNKFR